MLKKSNIKTFILNNIANHSDDIASFVCMRFSVSRMTATRYLQSLVKDKKIIKSGKTNNTRYYLMQGKNKALHFQLSSKLDEFQIFTQNFEQELSQLPHNQQRIFEYCCTELINNAKDHSQGKLLQIETRWEDKGLVIEIIDNGIGIFKKLQESMHLKDYQEGLLMLTKGKTTTDPKNHTGEGIFFSSRAVDRFEIESNAIGYIKDNVEDDWFYEKREVKKGTKITLFIDYDCKRELRDVFSQYTHPKEYTFDKTEILVELAKLGDERYISRSQAKRILTDLERFSRIVLDFRGIETVGQGFVDEVFRVFRQKNPNIQVTYCNANENIEFMIKRGCL